MELHMKIGSAAVICHKNKIFCTKFDPVYPHLLYSGGWDAQVKFWDLRQNGAAQTFSGIQVCGDSVDMSRDRQTLAIGGGTLGEGVWLYDLRNDTKPYLKIQWSSSGKNPLVNSLKFVPGQDLLVVGCNSDSTTKCFETKTGTLVHEFSKPKSATYAVDVSKDALLCALGDGKGSVHLENLNYTF